MVTAPYQRIVAGIRDQIAAGELRPGDRVPSIRRLASDHGVAIATATRALAALRDQGLVEARVGSGTVVSARAAQRLQRPATTGKRTHPLGAPPPGRTHPLGGEQSLGREHLLSTAIAVADAEGLDAVSMRRLAAELHTGPMSLYRYVAGKDDLVRQMADVVFGTRMPPEPGPDGWRAKLELISRLHWELFKEHLWLPRVISFTRPLMMPNAVAHTGWTLRAIDGLGLPPETMLYEAITLAASIVTVAMTKAAEVDAYQDSGLTFDEWWRTQEQLSGAMVARFPVLEQVPADAAIDLDALFEYGLALHLDGFARLVERHGRPS